MIFAVILFVYVMGGSSHAFNLYGLSDLVSFILFVLMVLELIGEAFSLSADDKRPSKDWLADE